MTLDTYKKLRNHEGLFRLVVENLRDHAIFTVDRDGRVATWNEGAERVLGFREREIVGRPVSLVFTPEDRQAGVPDREMAAARDHGVASDERWHIRKSGERFWGHGLMHALRNGEVIGFVKIVRDETPRKRAEDELRELNQRLESRVAERTDRLRKLARELNQTERRERRLLAERLHDHLQQLIIGGKLKLSPLLSQLEDEAAREAVEQTDRLLDEAVEESRAITRELSPPPVAEGGLAPALREVAGWLERTYGLKVDLSVEPEAEPASEDLRGFLLRAGRELLMNAVKHAAVQEAALSVDRPAEDMCRLTVEDGGRGFDAANAPEAASETGYGLRSVRERCELLGGRMRIDSTPGRGTRTTITLPMNGT